jgi:hypothetical protein
VCSDEEKLQIFDAFAKEGLGVPAVYIRHFIFWDKLRFSSHDEFMNIPYIEYYKNIKFSAYREAGEKAKK